MAITYEKNAQGIVTLTMDMPNRSANVLNPIFYTAYTEALDKAMADEIEAVMKSTFGKGVLWVLDGWDELPSDLPTDSIINKLILCFDIHLNVG